MLSKSQELVSAESVQDSLLCSANHPRQSGPLGRGEIHVPMVGMWRDSFGRWSWDSVLSTPVASISLAENAGLEVTRSQPSPANIAYATELCSFTDDVNEQARYQFQLGRVAWNQRRSDQPVHQIFAWMLPESLTTAGSRFPSLTPSTIGLCSKWPRRGETASSA